MKTVKHYMVEVSDPLNPGIIGHRKEFTVKDLNVVGENDKCFAVDDEYFTTIYKVDRYTSQKINKPVICLHSDDRVWGSRIRYSLYTDKTKRASTIRKEIEAEISEKYGFFFRGVDLSFVNEVVTS